MTFPGPPSSVIIETNNPGLYSGGSVAPVTGLSGLAYFSQSALPSLPSNISEIVNVTQNAYLGANVEIGGNLQVDGILTASSQTGAQTLTQLTVTPGPVDISGKTTLFGGLLLVDNQNSAPNSQAVGLQSPGVGDRMLGFKVTGDTLSRLRFFNDGKMEWGPGGASNPDCQLSRSSAGILQIKPVNLTPAVGGLLVNGGGTSTSVLTVTNTLANVSSQPALNVNVTNSGDNAFGVSLAADSVQRLQSDSNGLLQWGPGGTVSTDTNLYRGGASVLKSDNSLDIVQYALGQPQPRNHGLASWAFDPAQVAGNSGATNGLIYLVGQYINQATTLTKVWWMPTVAAGSAVSNQNWVGLYNSAGTILTSVNVDSLVTSSGIKSTTISQAVTPGFYWVGMVFNSGTATSLSLGRSQSVGVNPGNLNLANAVCRFATNGVGQTTLVNITPSSNVNLQPCIWAGLG